MTFDERPPALAISRLSKHYGATTALDDVSLSVRAGHVHALLGANGSGKSTVVKVVAGVVRGDPGGAIELGGARVASDRVTPEWARHAGLRVVHQDLALVPDLSVAENIALGSGFTTTRIWTIDRRALRTRATTLLDRFDVAVAPEARAGSLDPADRAMVAIARALEDDAEHDPATPPGTAHRTLLLDEALAPLGARDGAQVLTRLRAIADRGDAVLIVGHRIPELLAIADVVTVLRGGRVAGALSGPALHQRAVVELMTGGATTRAAGPRRTAPAHDEPALELEHLEGRRVHDVSISVLRGEVLGLVGAPGSGRSELLRMVFGAMPIRSGTVRVHGTTRRLRDIGDAMRAGIAYVPNDRAVATFPELSVTENLSAATVASYWRAGRLQTRAERRDTARALQQFSIGASAPDQPVRELSGGNQQKVVVARWLRRNPAVLLLDEPTRGVDVQAREEIADAVRGVVASGAAVVLVTDDYEELCALADRVVVLSDGRAVATMDGPLDPVRVAQLATEAPPPP